jgi:hypothetical protein
MDKSIEKFKIKSEVALDVLVDNLAKINDYIGGFFDVEISDFKIDASNLIKDMMFAIASDETDDIDEFESSAEY